MRTVLAWVVIVSLGYVLAETVYDRIITQSGRLVVQRDVQDPQTVLLEWTGEVAHPMAERIRTAFSENRQTANRFVLVLNSQGGALLEGSRVIQIMQTMQRTHTVDTVVKSYEQCASMCVPIFLAGDVRLAAPNSRWLFHEVRLADAIDGEERPLAPDDQAAITDDFVERFLARDGISRPWLAKMREQIRGRDYWVSGAELFEERTGIVTRLL